ncbi:MAG: lipid asymmetry maintenance protein MlaB [Ignavibacteria bacterium]
MNMPLQRIRLEGELSIGAAAAVREQLLAAIGGGAEVEVDLGSVTEIDSAGIQLMLAAAKEALAAGKRIRFAHPSPAVVDLFGLCGLAAWLADAATQEAAP